MLVETDDLLDSHEVAAALGLTSHRAVSTYRGRYDSFPAPIVDKGSGRAMLWLRSDIEAWARRRAGSADHDGRTLDR